MKEMAVAKLGGKCIFCGYHRTMAALDFHHIDETRKSFSLSTRGLTRSWTKISEELEKCVLVCSNCHREIHAGLIKLKDEAKNDKIVLVH